MREYLSIAGGHPLSGDVRVSGAKNCALPQLIATLLSSGECTLANVPDLDDIGVTLRLLRSTGAEVAWNEHRVTVRAAKIESSEAPANLVKAMRASFWVLGPLLARTGSARVALPGGDAIGTRPVDLHLKGLVRFGADIRLQNGIVIASAPGRLRPGRIELDFPSVGATHQLLMTAALIPGETIIEGAAREPEVVELARFIRSMGAEIEGEGSGTLRIVGREQLGDASAWVLGDRIEACTYLLAGAMTQGDVRVRGIAGEDLGAVLPTLADAGCEISVDAEGVRARAQQRLRAVSFSTAPFPGVATDVQPLLMAAMASAEGECTITETIFESRFGHATEYRRLGAQIFIDGPNAEVRGSDRLEGCAVEAGDIRAAAGLVLLGLVAGGTTEVYEIHHLDRGYEDMVGKLRSLGAQIVRVPAFDGKEVVLGC